MVFFTFLYFFSLLVLLAGWNEASEKMHGFGKGSIEVFGKGRGARPFVFHAIASQSKKEISHLNRRGVVMAAVVFGMKRLHGSLGLDGTTAKRLGSKQASVGRKKGSWMFF